MLYEVITRKAFSSLLSILKQEQAHRVGGIFHGFSGSLEVAREAIRLNFAIAFGGPVTSPNARRAPQTLQAIPAEWVVLETDAPDLPPYPHQGSNNRPCYLDLIARKVAELRGWTLPGENLVATEPRVFTSVSQTQGLMDAGINVVTSYNFV